MKRIFSAILAVVLLAGTTMFASAQVSSNAIDDSVAEITAEQEKLPTPEDLKWNFSHSHGKEMFGWIAWKAIDSKYNGLYMYSVKVYRDDVEIYITNTNSGVVNGYVGMNIGNQGIFTQSGEYRFTVSAKPFNPYGDYAQSDLAESRVYEYTLPEKKAVAVKKVSVNSDYSKLTFPTNDSSSYAVIIEYTRTGENTRIKFLTTTEYKNGKSEIRVKIADKIAEIIRNYDAEKIYIGVKALSPDPLTCQDSEIVWLSSPYMVPVDYFGKKVAELEDAYDISEEGNRIVNSLISELDEYVAEKNISIGDMRSSFEMRYGVMSDFVRLYAAYCNFNGIFDTAKDASKNDYFANHGINLGRVEEGGIVRYNNVNVEFAAFSALPKTSTDAAFTYTVLSEPKGNATPSELVYDKVFGIHINFEGVTNPEKLKYPVWIEIPLPSYMQPNECEISMLRLNSDGTFTPMECSPGYSSSSWNNYEEIGTISFIVESSGDYYFVTYVEDSPYDFDYDGKLTLDDVVSFVDTVIEAALEGWLGESYDNPYDINSDNSFDMQDLNDLMKLLREAQ